jgi:hypothetical protein
MKNTNEYNGWTNYQTWRINLEVVDGMTLDTLGFDLHEVDTDEVADVESLAEAIESYVEEIVTNGVPDGLALNLAQSFLSEVDWMEIAEHIISDAREG